MLNFLSGKDFLVIFIPRKSVGSLSNVTSVELAMRDLNFSSTSGVSPMYMKFST